MGGGRLGARWTWGASSRLSAGRGRERRLRSTSSSSPTTRARSCPARSSSACAARRATGTRSRRPPRRSVRRRSSSSIRSTCALPQLVVPDVRAAMPAAATLFFGDPTRELDVAAITGTNGKTTSAFLLHAILDADGRRTGLLTNIERRVGGDEPADRAQHARGARPAAALPPDGRRRRHGLRDGGDLDRAGAGAARRDAVRRARVHEPDAGPPRLPRLDGGVLRGQARALRAGRPRRGQRRRRVRPRGSRPSCPDAVTFDAGVRRARRDRPAAARAASTARTRSAPRSRRARSASATTRSGAASSPSTGVPGPLRGDRRGAAVRGDRRLRAHAGLARQRAPRRARRSATGGSSSSSAPAATATGRSGR